MWCGWSRRTGRKRRMSPSIRMLPSKWSSTALDWQATDHRAFAARGKGVCDLAGCSGSRVWQAESPVGRPASFEPVTHPDGSYEVMFDAEAATLLFVDREHELCGYRRRFRAIRWLTCRSLRRRRMRERSWTIKVRRWPAVSSRSM